MAYAADSTPFHNDDAEYTNDHCACRHCRSEGRYDMDSDCRWYVRRAPEPVSEYRHVGHVPK